MKIWKSLAGPEVSLWMSPRAQNHDKPDPESMEALARSHALLLILTPDSVQGDRLTYEIKLARQHHLSIIVAVVGDTGPDPRWKDLLFIASFVRLTEGLNAEDLADVKKAVDKALEPHAKAAADRATAAAADDSHAGAVIEATVADAGKAAAPGAGQPGRANSAVPGKAPKGKKAALDPWERAMGRFDEDEEREIPKAPRPIRAESASVDAVLRHTWQVSPPSKAVKITAASVGSLLVIGIAYYLALRQPSHVPLPPAPKQQVATAAPSNEPPPVIPDVSVPENERLPGPAQFLYKPGTTEAAPLELPAGHDDTEAAPGDKSKPKVERITRPSSAIPAAPAPARPTTPTPAPAPAGGEPSRKSTTPASLAPATPAAQSGAATVAPSASMPPAAPATQPVSDAPTAAATPRALAARTNPLRDALGRGSAAFASTVRTALDQNLAGMGDLPARARDERTALQGRINDALAATAAAE
ncbi:MAG: hypothetical protein NTW19_14215, partial [Planctomycetota bacterium]|nr:hypothetical protein [Planctomycetota bacterium]